MSSSPPPFPCTCLLLWCRWKWRRWERGMKSWRGTGMNPSGDSSVSGGEPSPPVSAQLCQRAESKYKSSLNSGLGCAFCVMSFYHLLQEHDPDVHALMCVHSFECENECVSDFFLNSASPDSGQRSLSLAIIWKLWPLNDCWYNIYGWYEWTVFIEAVRHVAKPKRLESRSTVSVMTSWAHTDTQTCPCWDRQK